MKKEKWENLLSRLIKKFEYLAAAVITNNPKKMRKEFYDYAIDAAEECQELLSDNTKQKERKKNNDNNKPR